MHLETQVMGKGTIGNERKMTIWFVLLPVFLWKPQSCGHFAVQGRDLLDKGILWLPSFRIKTCTYRGLFLWTAQKRHTKRYWTIMMIMEKCPDRRKWTDGWLNTLWRVQKNIQQSWLQELLQSAQRNTAISGKSSKVPIRWCTHIPAIFWLGWTMPPEICKLSVPGDALP